MSTVIELEPIVYELIGRVIVETALLEGRLIELAIRLDWQVNQSATFEDLQAKHAGAHGEALTKTVGNLAQAAGDALDQAAFADFVDRVAQRQRARNTIAHDLLFPLPDGGTVGFRTVSARQRSAADEITQFAILSPERLAGDLRLVKQVAHEAWQWIGQLPCPPLRTAATGSSG